MLGVFDHERQDGDEKQSSTLVASALVISQREQVQAELQRLLAEADVNAVLSATRIPLGHRWPRRSIRLC